MTQEARVNDTLGKIEAETRHEFIIDLFPEKSGIGFFVFHSWRSKEELAVQS